MPALLEIERAVARSLLDPEDGAVVSHIAEDGLAAERRLNIYRNTFVTSLTTALRLSHPAVHRLVGNDFFESAARIFIAAHPPRSACLDDYDPGFAGFIDNFAPAASIPYLAGVARLEWAVNRALHAPDEAALDSARLAALGPAEQAVVRFAPHPSVGLVRAAHPVDAVWRAVLAQDESAMAAVDIDAGTVRLLVRRGEDGVKISRLDEAAWRFTALLCAGRPLQAALDETDTPDAPALLACHFADGVFAAFAVGRNPMEEPA
jgi:Putative DNA-binding domain